MNKKQIIQQFGEKIIEEIEKKIKPDEPKRNVVRRSHIKVYNDALSDITQIVKEMIK